MPDLTMADYHEEAIELALQRKLGDDACILARGGLFSAQEIYELLTDEARHWVHVHLDTRFQEAAADRPKEEE